MSINKRVERVGKEGERGIIEISFIPTGMILGRIARIPYIESIFIDNSSNKITVKTIKLPIGSPSTKVLLDRIEREVKVDR